MIVPYTVHMITEIIAAGAMGVSVFFCIKAHSLLKDEQAKENPRPQMLQMLRSIYVFMGFALLMTPVALGIEYARHQMNLDNAGNDQAGVVAALEALQQEGHYATNKNGNPEALELSFGGETYQLAQPYPTDGFADTHLKLKAGGNGRYLALKNNNGEEITYGYFTADDLKRDLNDLLVIVNEGPDEPVDELLESKKMISTGLLYAPSSKMLTSIQSELSTKRANPRTSNRYLVDFASTADKEDPLQNMALDLLIQPGQMRELDSIKYDKLIATLAVDGVRQLPHRYYELAQVHYSRWAKYQREEDQAIHLQMLCKYVRSFDALTWINSKPEEYKLEHGWYREAKAGLASYRCDDDCKCV